MCGSEGSHLQGKVFMRNYVALAGVAMLAAAVFGCASSSKSADPRSATAQSAALENVGVVTVDNFARAESDLYMGKMVQDGSFEKFLHRREPATIENQTVIRLNR